MNFTQYRQILSYLLTVSTDTTLKLDIVDDNLVRKTADSIGIEDIQNLPDETLYDVISCRFVLSQVDDPYAMIIGLKQLLKVGGLFVIQDLVLPEKSRQSAYVNGIIQCFNKSYHQAFAQYAWDGLLLDSDLKHQDTYKRSISTTLHNWVELYQPSARTLQQIQVLLVQAPLAVKTHMEIEYAGTPYAGFTLHEIVSVAQKEE